jgi:hypothetical protein
MVLIFGRDFNQKCFKHINDCLAFWDGAFGTQCWQLACKADAASALSLAIGYANLAWVALHILSI